jgi:LCP family protein required for cell wall assembly
VSVEQVAARPSRRERRRARRRRAAIGAIVGALLVGSAVLVGLISLEHVAARNVERVDLPALAETDGGLDGPLNVLVVGSDSRDGLTDDQLRRLALGGAYKGGGRGDTVLIVSVGEDLDGASVVSVPRDLIVEDRGRERKLADVFADGPDEGLRVLQDNTRVPLHHYIEVSIPGFLSIVELVDGVDICLEAPLRDRKAAADLDAGCQRLGPEEALAFVRSRQTTFGDFDRIERQQKFLKGMVERITSTRTLVDLPRLFEVIEQASRHVRTDGALTARQMRELALELRSVADGELTMTALPSFATEIDGVSYVRAYPPGAEAVYAALRDGQPVPTRGSRDDRRSTRVAVWTEGGEEADRIQRTLFWAAFRSERAGAPPVTISETKVFPVEGREEQAGWVAAVLGVTLAELPAGVEPPVGADVIVATGVVEASVDTVAGAGR